MGLNDTEKSKATTKSRPESHPAGTRKPLNFPLSPDRNPLVVESHPRLSRNRAKKCRNQISVLLSGSSPETLLREIDRHPSRLVLRARTPREFAYGVSACMLEHSGGLDLLEADKLHQEFTITTYKFSGVRSMAKTTE